MHFIMKNYLWSETGTGRLNRPAGAEEVKSTERGSGENLAGGLIPPLVQEH